MALAEVCARAQLAQRSMGFRADVRRTKVVHVIEDAPYVHVYALQSTYASKCKRRGQ
jgi:hypothetical protein